MKWTSSRWIVPSWLSLPLMEIGVFFLFAKPIGYDDWVGYCLIVFASVVTGLFVRRRYHAKVLESSERGTTVLYTKR